MVIAYLEMILLNLLTLIEILDVEFGFSLIYLRVRILWFFDFPFYSIDTLFILSCVFVPFYVLLDDEFEVFIMQESREMVDREEVLEKGKLESLTKDSLDTHLTWELEFWVQGFILKWTYVVSRLILMML